MSKANRVKSDLDDVTSLLEIISVLKDVATNHFFSSGKRKQRFAEFAIAFTEFFRMVSLSNARSPLVHSEVDKTAVVLITSEGGFMGDITSKLVKKAAAEAESSKAEEIISIGSKGARKIKLLTDRKITIFSNIEEIGLYNTVLKVKDYIIKQVKEKKIGRILSVYPRAISLNFIKPVIVKLLPSDELLSKQENIKDTIEKVIVETDLNAVITYLADTWLTCRLYEMVEDCVIAGYAAQSQQLEASVDRLKKEKKGLVLSFRKAKKGDIDKSLREVFTAKMMSGGKR